MNTEHEHHDTMTRVTKGRTDTIPRPKETPQKAPLTVGGFGSKAYFIGDEEIAYIKENIKKHGGSFFISVKGAKELVAYSGTSDDRTFIINLDRNLQKHGYRAGSMNGGANVRFYEKPAEAKPAVEDDDDDE